MTKPTPEDVQYRPNQDGRNRDIRKDRHPVPGAGGETPDVDADVSAADKQVRTGKTEESVRNTPPFGDHDDLKH